MKIPNAALKKSISQVLGWNLKNKTHGALNIDVFKAPMFLVCLKSPPKLRYAFLQRPLFLLTDLIFHHFLNFERLFLQKLPYDDCIQKHFWQAHGPYF